MLDFSLGCLGRTHDCFLIISHCKAHSAFPMFSVYGNLLIMTKWWQNRGKIMLKLGSHFVDPHIRVLLKVIKKKCTCIVSVT